MIDDRNLTKKYRETKKQETPDLWDRIESELRPVERSAEVPPGLTMHQEANDSKAGRKKGRRYRQFGWAAAAAVFGVVVIGSRLGNPAGERSGSPTNVAEATVGKQAAVDAEDAAGTAVALETTIALQEAVPEREGMEPAGPGTAASDVALLTTGTLQIPANARTVPYDAEYFSEDILRETDLLCGGVITDVAFAYDDQGNAIYVSYNMTISKVYYAEDYVSGMDTITVASPIIETDGDEAYLLYQMQIGRHYLLPLTGQPGNWELLYPFAPQIQVLDEQSYKFHSGYSSLINHQTEVAKGISEGENDFYYDRMLIRNDNNFLSELISLVN